MKKQLKWALGLIAIPALAATLSVTAIPPGGPAPFPGACGYQARINVVHNVTGQTGWRATFASSLSDCWNNKIPSLYQSAYNHNETPSNPVCVPQKYCAM